VNGREHKYETFQGQELEEELGKNTLAYQWRDYDPAIGRFNKIDRFSEKYVDASPYNFTANNPIAFREVKGDSIRTYFYNKKGKESSTIPKAVQKMFNDEFGIKVGYNAKTNMLYYDGNVDSDLSQSESATGGLVSALKDNNTGRNSDKHGTILFGHDLKDMKTGARIQGGAWTRTGGLYRNGVTQIDLADFDSKGNNAFFEFSKAMNPRSFNMARIFEHEYFGHGGNMLGAGADGGLYTTGKAVRATNVFRRERKLNERLHYGYGSNIIYFGNTGNYSSRGAQRKAVKNMVNGSLSNELFVKIHIRRKN
jgi:RHS repeat-associated protein